MLKYDDLKKSSDGMPMWNSLIPAVMSMTVQRELWHSKDFKRNLADSLGLSSDLRNKVYVSGNGVVIEDRIGWAMSHLKIAGLAHTPKRGHWEATSLGRELYDKYGDKLDEKITREQEKFIRHNQLKLERREQGDPVQTLDYEDTQYNEIMSQAESSHKDEIATQLLEKIYNETPSFFENLSVKLLVAMGYKGLEGFAHVTSSTRDGGIDGVIKQDPLGIGRVYIQAKRYQKANKVGRPDIDAFYGALRRERADRGVFITSSSFSKDAEDAARDFSIVTIDGIQLTDLMLQYGVGVKVEQSYNLYKIDEDFLEEC